MDPGISLIRYDMAGGLGRKPSVLFTSASAIFKALLHNNNLSMLSWLSLNLMIIEKDFNKAFKAAIHTFKGRVGAILAKAVVGIAIFIICLIIIF